MSVNPAVDEYADLLGLVTGTPEILLSHEASHADRKEAFCIVSLAKISQSERALRADLPSSVAPLPPNQQRDYVRYGSPDTQAFWVHPAATALQSEQTARALVRNY